MEKLREAIRHFLSLAASSRKNAAAKGRITKLVNESAVELGTEKARGLARTVLALVIVEDQPASPASIDRVELLKNRFDPKSLYTEGDRIFGWYDPNQQVQAEELPLCQSEGGYHVSFYRLKDELALWRLRGFEPAKHLPTIRRGDELKVEFNLKRLPFWLKHGYALPCELPWHRGRFDNNHDECLWVDRSIISAGWWCAYKWWPDCQWWYYEKHPEWFADMDWWETYEPPAPVRYEPIDDPYAAVLGGTL